MLAALVLIAVTASADAGVDPLRAEARRRNDALVHEGFNFTWGLSFDGGVSAFELLVPPSPETHRVEVWLATRDGGAVSARLLGPDGGTVRELARTTRWDGALPAGRSRLLVTASGPGRGLVAVRGPVLSECPVERVREVPADATRGFSWPYLVYTPAQVKRPEVLVAPNNTGFVGDALELLRASATCDLRRHVRLADRLGVQLIMPLFPRPAREGGGNLYLHALTRAALEAREPSFRRVDLQLEAMLEHAGAKRVLLSGFSASGSFVQRFALLHPARVIAVASGSPGGWPTVPLERFDGVALPWPVGVEDVEALTGARFDVEAARRVRFLFFRGSDDGNDAVPYRDSFSAQDEALIKQHFGVRPGDRWWAAEALYARAGLPAQFARFPGVAHDVTDAMEASIAGFFEEALQPATASKRP